MSEAYAGKSIGKIMIFTQETCPPCKIMKTVVKQVRKNTGVQVEYVDVGNVECKECGVYNISSTPTIILVDPKGEELDRYTGLVTTDKLTNKVKGYIESNE